MIYFSTNACEIKNNEFDFKYKLSQSNFTFDISKKNNEIFQYYQKPKYGFDSEFGLVFMDGFFTRTPINKDNFYSSTNNYFSSDLYSGKVSEIVSYEGGRIHKAFHTAKIYSQNIDIKEYIYFLRKELPEPYQYGNQNVKFNVRFYLDSEMKTCVSFDTKTIKINFGNYYFITVEKILKDWTK